MSNPFYMHGAYPVTGGPGSSAALRAELEAIETGFDGVQADTTAKANAAAAASTPIAHATSTANPHSVTKAQVGLGNADNTSDANKPVSAAQAAALAGKAPLTGAGTSGTWPINISGNAATAGSAGTAASASVAASCSGNSASASAPAGYWRTVANATPVAGSVTQGMLVTGTPTTAAAMTFIREGVYAINFGLDADNVFRLGGYSDGAVYRWTADTVGNFWARGNVSAYSDERVKTNWRDLGEGFLARLAEVKCGIYDRTDQDLTQVGVSAQSLREVLPHAVIDDGEGNLSVAYGNAALVACIELAKRVVALEAKISEMCK